MLVPAFLLTIVPLRRGILGAQSSKPLAFRAQLQPFLALMTQHAVQLGSGALYVQQAVCSKPIRSR